MKILPLTLLSLFMATSFCRGADASVKDVARKLFLNHKDSVVGVVATISVEASGGGQTFPTREDTIETLGTVISDAGMTVLSYSAIDPTVGISNQKMQGPQGPITIEATIEFKEVRLRLGDGTEVPAKIVLTDKDLDLAFIVPDKDSEDADEEVTFAPVKLEEGVSAKVLDDIIMLSRLDKTLSRSPSIATGQVTAVVKKPRTFYQTTIFTSGVPTFTAEGKVLGLMVRRIASGVPAGPVIIPTSELIELAEQARAEADKE